MEPAGDGTAALSRRQAARKQASGDLPVAAPAFRETGRAGAIRFPRPFILPKAYILPEAIYIGAFRLRNGRSPPGSDPHPPDAELITGEPVKYFPHFSRTNPFKFRFSPVRTTPVTCRFFPGGLRLLAEKRGIPLQVCR